MKKRSFLTLLLIGVLTLIFAVGCGKDNKEVDKPDGDVGKEGEKVELLVSAAASLKDVLEDIEKAYKTHEPNTKLIFTLGGSGALQTQIEEGAPVDLFISAAQKQMDALEEGSLILEDTRKTLLLNKVVLITPKDGDKGLNAFEDLLEADIEKIAIGDPASVPVGQYSEEIFNSLNLYDGIRDKLVLANDVRTVLAWVESGEVDCGVVYATDAFTSDKVKIITEAPEGSHKDVTYPAAVIKDSENIDSAKAFLDFLSTDEAKALFEKYGFNME
ncbi:MAG: molybdate ABC transporter substrate-binding protein [Tissierellia bacterium]|nr:molybdate ABC transporter substrate-binding protein [Tissierellia bacterium]